jgi:NTE family protein
LGSGKGRSGQRQAGTSYDGGGSLGAVEVGMLEALVEAGVRADLIVGASAGAVNGAHFAGRPDAAGVRALRAIWQGLRARDVFPFSPLGSLLGVFAVRDHIVDPGPLRRLLEKHLRCRTLEDASVPLHVVAAPGQPAGIHCAAP